MFQNNIAMEIQTRYQKSIKQWREGKESLVLWLCAINLLSNVDKVSSSYYGVLYLQKIRKMSFSKAEINVN